VFYGKPIPLPAKKKLKEIEKVVGGVSRDRSAEAVRMKMMKRTRQVDPPTIGIAIQGFCTFPIRKL
jgi:hypothetical protein